MIIKKPADPDWWWVSLLLYINEPLKHYLCVHSHFTNNNDQIMLTKKLFSVLAVFFGMALSFGAYAQNVTVTGTVTDNIGPVGMVVVYVPGSAENTMTDLDGKYSISVPSNATLEFSCIGYEVVQVPVNGRTVVDVVLVSDNVLEDAVVLGYGATTKKKDLSAAVGVVDNVDALAARPVSSAQAMLQGQVAGVNISADGGAPTSTPNVVIRGQGSQNGDSVLWVVDGIPGAPFSMNDVESIVVLKDAASAAIYGAQSGAGGVILVTTKKSGEKGISVDYDGVYGVRQATNLIQSLDAQQQMEMRKISHTNAGLDVPAGWNPSVNPWIATTRTNWMDEIFREAFYQRHSVALNYNTDKLKSRLSLSYDDNNGVLVGTYQKTLQVRYVGEYNINKWVKVTEDLTYKLNEGRSTDTNSGYTGTILSAIYMPQSAEAYKADGSYGGTTTEDPAYIAQYGSNFSALHGDCVNPLRLLLADTRVDEKTDFWSTTGLEIHDIVKGLKFNSRFTYNQYQTFYKNFSPRRLEVGKPVNNNTLDYSTQKEYRWKTENTLTYDRTFGKHTVGGLVATTADHYYGRKFNITAKDFPAEEEYLQYLAYAGAVGATDEYLGADANVAIVARGAYSYDDRYFVTASWRRDYAARLPKQKYGDFPAVTGAWKISNEDFFPKTETVSLLKLRASWGRIGNLGSVGMTYKSPTLSKTSWNSEPGAYGAEANTICGSFLYYRNALNQALTWETSQQLDLGLDFNMFSDRLTMAFDFYDKKTYGLIQDKSMGWTTSIGLSAMKVNEGEIRNRGFEATIGWSDTVGNWSYWVNGNYSFNKNWVSNIGVKDAQGNPGVWTGDGSYRAVPYAYQTSEGMPLNSFYLVECLGIFQSEAEVQAHQKDGKLIQPNAQPGDLKFADANGDGKIDTNDRQYFGNAMPHSTFSLSAGFTWKNLSASMMLQGVAGAKSYYVGKYSIYSDTEGSFNRAAGILDAWSPQNTDSNIPRLSKTDLNNNFTTASTWYLEDASYLRIKNFTVGYDFTELLRKSTHFGERNSRLSVYFSGENLFTFTKYSGMDPECGGYDALKYPVSRILSLGVKLTY